MLTYLLAGLAYALVFTAAWMLAVGGGFIIIRFLWLLSCFLWPTALALVLLVAVGRAAIFRILLGYFLLLGAVLTVVVIRNPGLDPLQPFAFWIEVNIPATLIFVAALYYRICAVGPLVLVFMLIGVTGALLAIQILGLDDRLLRPVVVVATSIGLDAVAAFVLIQLIGFALLSVFGWIVLRAIGRCYREKRFSDQMLMLDALWLTFVIVQSTGLVPAGGWVRWRSRNGRLSHGTFSVSTGSY